MDPDAALVEAREAARIVLDGNDAEALEAAVTLAERFQALDGWLMVGGFAPEAWLDKRPAPGKDGLTSSETDWEQFARATLRLALERLGYPTKGQHTIELPIAAVTALVGLAAQVQQLTTGEV